MVNKFGLQYTDDDKRYLLSFEVTKIFKKFWSVFNNINLENFRIIGEKHSLILQDDALAESILLTLQTYEEWQIYLSNQKKAQNSYKELTRFLRSENCTLAQLPEIIAYEFDNLYDYELVEHTIAMTFKFENPEIVFRWRQEAKKKTPLQRFFFNVYYSTNFSFYEYELKEHIILFYNRDFLEEVVELINPNGFNSICDIDVAFLFEVWEKKTPNERLIDL